MSYWETFDPQEAAKDTSDCLPAGEHLVMMKGPRWIDTRSGTGQIFFLTFESIDGESKGYATDIGFNLVNENKTAERIARSELGKICLAAGMMGNPRSESEFEGKTLVLEVTEDEYNGRKQNRFASARPSNGAIPSAKPAAATNGKPPWDRG